MKTTPGRRELRFTEIAQIAGDVNHLLANGYEQKGNWTLGQVCFHLNCWIKAPMDGYPRLPILLRPVFFIVRKTMAKKILRDVFAKNAFPEKSSTAPVTVAGADVNDAAEVLQLTETLKRWEAYKNAPKPSPLFGKMDRETIEKLHCVHAAHHLSFLVPVQK